MPPGLVYCEVKMTTVGMLTSLSPTLPQSNPTIPALFMLHERKLASTHSHFVNILAEKVPALNSSNAILVTDGEPGFAVISSYFYVSYCIVVVSM